MIAVGLVDRVDALALEKLANAYARVVSAACRGRRWPRHPGKPGPAGRVPRLRIEREAVATFTRLAEHFGLTPVARARIGLAELHQRALSAVIADALGPVDLVPIDVE